jgi:hypothetical protein
VEGGVTPTGPRPVASAIDAQAAPEDTESDAGKKDSGTDSGPTPLIGSAPVPPPRPKAPMPMGAFQSCGTYDGPLCVKDCKNGACRQECDGVKCELNCADGYCSQLCGLSGDCKLTCKGGHCIQVCARQESCVKECAGGDCQ